MQDKIYCKKCLLRDMDTEAFFADLKKYIDRISPCDRTHDDEYERRLKICGECDYLSDGTCQKCGCYVELRAAAKKNHCPHTPRRW